MLHARQMHHVFNHPMHGSDKLRIGGSVEDLFPNSTRSHKASNLQKPQMVCHGGTAHVHDGVTPSLSRFRFLPGSPYQASEVSSDINVQLLKELFASV